MSSDASHFEVFLQDVLVAGACIFVLGLYKTWLYGRHGTHYMMSAKSSLYDVMRIHTVRRYHEFGHDR